MLLSPSLSLSLSFEKEKRIHRGAKRATAAILRKCTRQPKAEPLPRALSLSLFLLASLSLSLFLPDERERERERKRKVSRAADAARDAAASPRSILFLVVPSISLFFFCPTGLSSVALPPSSPRRCHDSTAYRLREYFFSSFLLKRGGQPRWIRLSHTLSIVEFSILQREESFFFLNLNGMNLEVFGEMFPYLLILFRREKKLSKKRKLDILLQGIIRKIEK